MACHFHRRRPIAESSDCCRERLVSAGLNLDKCKRMNHGDCSERRGSDSEKTCEEFSQNAALSKLFSVVLGKCFGKRSSFFKGAAEHLAAPSKIFTARAFRFS